MTPEGKIKKAIKTLLIEQGCWFTMPMQTGFGRKGVPDFLVCAGGKFLAIEAKAAGGVSTGLQELEQQKIRDAGGVSIVISPSNIDKLPNLLGAMVCL